jgi:hypothetical protein
VGLALLLTGIFKYKDKLLVAIGALAILFTVGFYSFLFYYMKNGDLPKKGFAQISQMQLNGLVKNIEFYKLQHNQYPDSLQQLITEDEMASVYDPIQMLQQNRSINYEYERVENRYLLFSVGPDGLANTADDLFPQIVINDSSKIGWIRKK